MSRKKISQCLVSLPIAMRMASSSRLRAAMASSRPYSHMARGCFSSSKTPIRIVFSGVVAVKKNRPSAGILLVFGQLHFHGEIVEEHLSALLRDLAHLGPPGVPEDEPHDAGAVVTVRHQVSGCLRGGFRQVGVGDAGVLNRRRRR